MVLLIDSLKLLLFLYLPKWFSFESNTSDRCKWKGWYSQTIKMFLSWIKNQQPLPFCKKKKDLEKYADKCVLHSSISAAQSNNHN